LKDWITIAAVTDRAATVTKKIFRGLFIAAAMTERQNRYPGLFAVKLRANYMACNPCGTKAQPEADPPVAEMLLCLEAASGASYL
jgi:hypothetical protein